MSKFSRATYVISAAIHFGFLHLVKRHDDAQQVMFEKLSKLGGLYVKFLQLIAVREDVQDVRYAGFKDSLAVFDQAEYEKINVAYILDSELGHKAADIHLDSTEPFAAGSFGQVYAGALNGQTVIVKVLRPSVVRFLEFDLRLLSFMSRVVSFFQPQTMLDLNSVFTEFKRVTLQEIDYKHEARTASNLHKSLSANPVIQIPTTFLDYSTEHIIVQEKVGGIALTEILSNRVSGNKLRYVWDNLGTNLDYVMEELAVELLGGSLSGHGTHGDPHPGNIFILPNNKIALIDFGIDAVVSQHKPQLLALIDQYAAMYRGQFDAAKMSRALVNYFVPDLTKSLQSLSVYFGKQDLVEKTLAEIGNSAESAMEDHINGAGINALVNERRVVYLFTTVINKDNRFGLKANLEAPAFLRSVQIFFNICHRLGCDQQLFLRGLERVFEANQFTQMPDSGFDYDNESIDRSMHTVAAWFERLHYSDPGLYNRITNAWAAAQ